MCIPAEIGNDMDAFGKADNPVGWATARSNKSFLGKKFHCLSKRMKSQKALLAITRKILVIIFNILKTGLPFDPTRNLQALACLRNRV
jgi:aspartyl/asparaginyl beta-hydroxylase (cupin superfamily)